MNPKSHPGHLGKVQRAVINDLLKSQLPEHEVLEKHKINPWRYKRWLENGLFAREFNARVDARMRQSKLLMLGCLPKATEKLAHLIDSEKEETARKACVDAISLWKNDDPEQMPAKNDCQDQPPQLSQEKAAKIWAVLAEKDEKPTNHPPVIGN